MEATRYSEGQKSVWNDFVHAAKNGTFLFLRDYMDYHADRFPDCSLMFKNERGHLLAVLPAHYDAEQRRVGSHGGLTFGGFVLSPRITAEEVIALFQTAKEWMQSNLDAETWFYKPVPYIYSTLPAQEDLYALFLQDAQLTERRLSSVVEMDHCPAFRTTRKQGCARALKAGITIEESDDLPIFWGMLDTLLEEKYATHPVHTLSEIQLLKERFPQQIRLFLAKQNEHVVGGTLIYEYRQVAHCQYIASTSEGRSTGALDMLFTHLLHERFLSKRYFDFGTSVEQGGRVLNGGLIFQKEGFGGRGVVYDTYEMKLT
jgi:hypothetical protein